MPDDSYGYAFNFDEMKKRPYHYDDIEQFRAYILWFEIGFLIFYKKVKNIVN